MKQASVRELTRTTNISKRTDRYKGACLELWTKNKLSDSQTAGPLS
jgi:hypothetical protein